VDLLFVCAVTFMAGIAQAATGFGFGLLAMPLFTLFLEPRVAVPLGVCVSLLGSYLVLFETRQQLDRPSLGRLAGGSLLGLPLGVLVLLALPEAWLRVAVGGIAMGFCTLLWTGWAAPVVGARMLWGAGALGGLLNSACGLAGPPIVLALHGRALSTQGFRGTLAGFMAASGTLALGFFALGGLLDPARLLRYSPAFAALWVANRIGRRLSTRVESERFRRGVLKLLFVGALAATLSALEEILR